MLDNQLPNELWFQNAITFLDTNKAILIVFKMSG